jgi:hypothetical protein
MDTPDWLRASIEKHVRDRYLERGIHLAVSLTDRCPLKCSNCIVSAVHGTRVDIEKSLRLADRIIEELRVPGNEITTLTFTGGEAPLAKAAFSRLGTDAAQLGIRCALITSGYWASTLDRGRRFLEAHNFIGHVTVSIDRFHLDDLALSIPLNAVGAALGLGLEVKIRVTLSEGSSPHDAAISQVMETYPSLIETQAIVNGGRAREGGLSELRDDQILSQCFTSGPHIDHLGKILPFCSNIIYIGEPHALDLGNIFNIPVGALAGLYREHALLNTVKVLGWDYVRNQAGIVQAGGVELRCQGGCRQCELVMSDSAARDALTAWVSAGCATQTSRDAIAWINSPA